MIRLVRLVALALLALGWSAAASAQTEPRRIALLIGNADYDRNNAFDDAPKPWFVKDLKNPCNDVNLVKKSLSRSFEVFDFCNIDHKEFAQRVDEFAARTQDLPKKSIVFIYYAGHGMQHFGRLYMMPTMMQFNQPEINRFEARKQLEYFQQNANELSTALDMLTADANVGVVVAMDSCRNNPVDSDGVFNETVSIKTGANTLIQYATTPGDTTPDGVGDNSQYASVLAAQLARGGDVGAALARVQSIMWKEFSDERRNTYVVTQPGPAFAALGMLSLATVAPPQPGSFIDPTLPPSPELGWAATTSVPTVAIKRALHKIAPDAAQRTRLDIIWCEGKGEAANFNYAWWLGHEINRRATELKVGRIQLKPLSERKNRVGGPYNVRRNLMRYDPSDKFERDLLIKIAAAFPDGEFLPQAGRGVRGAPTSHYVSAFVCSGGAGVS